MRYTWQMAKNKLKSNKVGKRRAIAVCILTSLIVASATAVIIYTRKRDTTRVNTKPTSVQLQKDNQNPNVPAYAVLHVSSTNTSTRIEIYTKATSDDELVKLNDALLNKYKQTSTNLRVLYIDYFDDQAAANNYFTKITDPKLSAKDKSSLSSHYIGVMFYQEKSIRQLYRNYPASKLLKSY